MLHPHLARLTEAHLLSIDMCLYSNRKTLIHICLAFHNRTLANNVEPDQTPQNTASDKGLQCLHLGHEFLIRKEDTGDRRLSTANSRKICC